VTGVTLDAIRGLKQLPHRFNRVWGRTWCEFFAALPENDYAHYEIRKVPFADSTIFWVTLAITIYSCSSHVRVESPKRSEIERIFNIFEKYAPQCAVPESQGEKGEEQNVVKVFIGHGRSSEWKELKDHLQDDSSEEFMGKLGLTNSGGNQQRNQQRIGDYAFDNTNQEEGQ
jgi:hypothetical protein